MPEVEQKRPRPRGTGCLFQQHGGPVWWLKYSHNGKVFRESTKQTSKAVAEKMLRTRLAELTTGTFNGPQIERIRVSELATDLLRDYRINGRKSIDDVTARWELHLAPFFGHLRTIEVTSTKLNQYVDQRQQEKAANATINRELAAMKRMFNLGRRATPPKVVRIPAFSHLKENNIRQGFVEFTQYRKLCEATSHSLWLRTLLELGHTYGWRDYSELLCMKVKQIDLIHRTIRLEPNTTKNDEGRTASMTDSVCTLLTACITGKSADDYVFTRENGKPVKDFRDAWDKARKAAGVPTLLFHDLRRSAVRNLVNSGVPERVAMKISGHKTRSVFDRYHIVNQRDIESAMVKLQGSQDHHAKAATQNGHKDGHNGDTAMTVMPTATITGNA